MWGGGVRVRDGAAPRFGGWVDIPGHLAGGEGGEGRNAKRGESTGRLDSLPHPIPLLPPSCSQARRQAEAVSGVLKNVRGQVDAMSERLREAEATHLEASQKERDLQEEHGRVLNAQARGRMQVWRRGGGAGRTWRHPRRTKDSARFHP